MTNQYGLITLKSIQAGTWVLVAQQLLPAPARPAPHPAPQPPQRSLPTGFKLQKPVIPAPAPVPGQDTALYQSTLAFYNRPISRTNNKMGEK